MSSLRLALKQSLQEAGHVVPSKKERKKKNKSASSMSNINNGNSNSTGNSSNNNNSSSNTMTSKPRRRQPRQPGEPPRKRGRPRKHPIPVEQQQQQPGTTNTTNTNTTASTSTTTTPDTNSNRHNAGGGDEDDKNNEHEDDESTENEFSYDSEEEDEEEDESEGEEQQHSEGEEQQSGKDEEEDDDGDNNHGDDDDDDDDEREHSDAPERTRPFEDHDGEGEGEDNDEASIGGDEEEYIRRKKLLKKKKRLLLLESSTEQHNTASDEERRKLRKLLKKQLKHSAANMIQNQWKKKKGQHELSEPEPSELPDASNHQTEKVEASSSSAAVAAVAASKRESPTRDVVNSDRRKKKDKVISSNSSSKSQTVPSPTIEVLEWSRNLSEKRCRRNVSSGMRVKVRFATKVKREGKVIKKRIWYGGRVSAVSKEGSKIRIKYDDNTSEISKFPDKDVVVDDAFNGKHLVPADKFMPPSVKEEEVEDDEEEEFDGMEGEDDEDEDEHEDEHEPKSEPQSEPPKSESIPAEQSAKPQPQEQEVPAPVLVPVLVPVRLGDNDSAENKPTMKEERSATLENITADTEPAKPAEELTKEVEMTPVARVAAAAAGKSIILRDLVAPPEEVELSRRLSFPPKKDSPKVVVKPMAVDEPPPKEAPKQMEIAPPEPVKEPEAAGAAPMKEKPEAVIASPPVEVIDSPPVLQHRPSLTIRITNIKQEDKDGAAKKGAAPLSPIESDSEEELFADTPVTVRKVKSIELKHPEDKYKRKRVPSDASEEAPPPKRRIHLNRDREVEAERIEESKRVPDVVMIEPQAPEKPAEVQDVMEDLSAFANQIPDRVEGSPKKEHKIVSVTLRRSDVEKETLSPPALPKLKKKKDRASSPKPGRRSPADQRSRSPARSESPAILLADESNNADADVINPVSRTLIKSASTDDIQDTPNTETLCSTPRKSVMGSKNSAFSRKKPKHLKETVEIPADQQDDPPTLARSQDGSKASTDSLPSARSGRRAAQQAKEKLNSKPDPNAVLESGKKKKKRRRKEGEDGGESDESADDRQWVQCDSCGKWRILPSHVKITSLPKHWYCRLNTYDAKRNSCSSPEQTAKQAAKEWRRARKRAKMQRLEQCQMEEIPEEPKKPPKEVSLTPTASPKPAKGVKRLGSVPGDSKHSSPTNTENNSPVDDPVSELHQKIEKKAKKGRPQTTPDLTPVAEPVPEPKKPGRKRGRPARNQTPAKEKDDSDNVEWVQCEKCEKWRKLPPHISADELPDKWYCTMNNWNPGSSTCDAAEDKADAHHHEIGTYAGQVIQGAAGKYSYRSLIFGTGRKHNRPMSERSRAAESLFVRPADDDENPHPTVMYSKSSAFLPRTSNFTKANAVEEKVHSIFDVLSNSEMFAELKGVGQPMDVLSNSKPRQAYPKFLTFENLPEDVKQAMREVVLQTLGSGALAGDDVIRDAQRYPWESLSSDFSGIREYFNADIIINTLLALVRDGLAEMTCLRDHRVPIAQWIPKYRRVQSRRALEIDAAMKASRCMKISKPWKQREESNMEWISGGAAFT